MKTVWWSIVVVVESFRMQQTPPYSYFQILRTDGHFWIGRYSMSSSHGNFSIDIHGEQMSQEGGLPVKLLYLGQRQIVPHTAMALRYGHQDAITVIILAMTSRESMETTNTACGASKHVTKLPGRQPQDIELRTVSVLWLLMRSDEFVLVLHADFSGMYRESNLIVSNKDLSHHGFCSFVLCLGSSDFMICWIVQT